MPYSAAETMADFLWPRGSYNYWNPGKKQLDSSSGPWDRDLSIDLEAIQSFGARALVTLMETEELEGVHVPLRVLASEAREYGLEWHHLPVEDIKAPDDRFEDLWTYSGLRLRSILARGDRVVVQCRGGLGRTGTVAGRLLIEFGDLPDVAIRKVREARPGSIETHAQEEYVRRCRPIAFARVLRSQEERALACIVGGAIGDAFGYEVEFMRLPEIRQTFGCGGIQTPVFHDGKLRVSDDTQMTLFTLEGLLRHLQNDAWGERPLLDSIRGAYLDWLDTQRQGDTGKSRRTLGWLARRAEMRVRRAPGVTCERFLLEGGRGTIDRPANDSKGCGGAMRVAPVGLLGPSGDARLVFQLAAKAAALTHGHPSGYLSAGVVACIIRILMDGARLTTQRCGFHGSGAIDQSCQVLSEYGGHEETLAAVRKAVELSAGKSTDHAAIIEPMGGGWVGEEALAIALYAVLSAESFVEAIQIAANHSGDSDSTASIAGQLWGATKGLEGIPHEWVTNLDVLLPLLHLARQLILRSFR